MRLGGMATTLATVCDHDQAIVDRAEGVCGLGDAGISPSQRRASQRRVPQRQAPQWRAQLC